jgi:hypothetical protein
MDEQEMKRISSEFGKMGGEATKAKYGVEYFGKIGSMAWKKKKKKKNEKK